MRQKYLGTIQHRSDHDVALHSNQGKFRDSVIDQYHRVSNGIYKKRVVVLPSRLISIFLLAVTVFAARIVSSVDNNDKDQVDPCEACQLVVKSFEKGLEKTARGKYEGGDTSWEEKNLKSYTDSEVRLVEIQEDLCDEVNKGKAQCLSLAENSESDIEEWWFKHRKKNVRLNDFLCINKLKRCCSKGHFGPTCQKCPTCNSHGTCNGSGTREGTGACICDQGYDGKDCELCGEDYFKIATNDNQFNCLNCDFSCKGCYGPGASNCTECRSGYRHDERSQACVDINECDLVLEGNGDAQRLCKGNTYCVNTDGYYKCADCHEACSGCYAYGPDKCMSCAAGYQMDRHRYCLTDEEMETLIKIDGSGWRFLRPQLIYLIIYQTATSMIIFHSILSVLRYCFGDNTRTTILLSVVFNVLCRRLVDSTFISTYESLKTEVNSE